MFSRHLDVRENGRQISRLETAFFREAGSFTIDGVEYQIAREPGWSDFVLRAGSREMCRARRRSMFRRSFVVAYRGEDVILTPVSPFHRLCQSWLGKTQVGEIRPRGFFSSSAAVALPEEMTRAEQVFIGWLVIVMWRRARRSQ